MQVQAIKSLSSILVVAAFGLASAGSVAQGVSQESMERCEALGTTEARLACYEELTRAGRTTAVSGEDVVPQEHKAPEVPVVVSGEDDNDQWSPVADESAVVETKQADSTVVMATVVDVTTGRFDILTFHFSNGEAWQQTQARRFRYPKDSEFDVSITTGLMGDSQLRVGGEGPMTRVRRIR